MRHPAQQWWKARTRYGSGMRLPFERHVSKTGRMLLETLKRHWWIPVLRGVAAIIFGVIAFTHPLMAAAVVLRDVVTRQIGSDVLFEGLVGAPSGDNPCLPE